MVRVDIVFKHYNSQLQVLRGRVLRAFLQAGIEPHWHEWDLRQKNLPPIIASKGALTVLVNGVDVLNTGSTLLERFYRFIGFFDGGGDAIPSTARITQVLSEQKIQREEYTAQPSKRFNLWLVSSVLPLLALSFFADTLCSHCGSRLVGLQGGVMSADFKYFVVFTVPVVLFSLFLALGALLYRVRERHGYKPLIMTVLGLMLIFYGHFLVISNAFYLTGVGLVLIASVWNAQSRTFQTLHDCPRCPALRRGSEIYSRQSQTQVRARDLLAFNQLSR
jgi:hypothetical protein